MTRNCLQVPFTAEAPEGQSYRGAGAVGLLQFVVDCYQPIISSRRVLDCVGDWMQVYLILRTQGTQSGPGELMFTFVLERTYAQ